MKNKIRIRLKAYSHDILRESCKQIMNTISLDNNNIAGPISMPTRRKIYCVLRSPHVDKDSREHFEVRIHTKIMDLYEPSTQTIDALMKLNIPAGVDIEIKL